MAIQRIDHSSSSTHGWEVRVGPHVDKLTKFFADGKWGGRDAANVLAKECEATLLSALSKRAKPQPTMLSTNRSGIVGIRPMYGRPKGDGVPVLRIQASWKVGDRCGSTSFSTDRHGRLGAVALAISAREKGMGQSVGLTPRQAWARMQPMIGDLAS